MFEEVVHNFGKSDGDIILWQNAYFHLIQMGFHGQLEQKILEGSYYIY